MRVSVCRCVGLSVSAFVLKYGRYARGGKSESYAFVCKTDLSCSLGVWEVSACLWG